MEQIAVNSTMEYKGYTGSIEFSEKDGLYCGTVLGIRSLISYDGSTKEALEDCFHDMLDFYLESCKERGEEPEVPYMAPLSVRLEPELYRQSAIYAAEHKTTLGDVVETALRRVVATQ